MTSKDDHGVDTDDSGAAAAGDPVRGVGQPHLVKRTLTEMVEVPAHMPRVATPEYRKIHHQLVVIEDRPCLVCGVRNSTLLSPPDNPYGASAIETHHHLIEWSLANCIDLAKFNRRIVARFREEGRPGYETDYTQSMMEDWIDHSPENLWTLCDTHHRGVDIGIHFITGPIWGALDLVKDGYDLVRRPGQPDELQGHNDE